LQCGRVWEESRAVYEFSGTSQVRWRGERVGDDLEREWQGRGGGLGQGWEEGRRLEGREEGGRAERGRGKGKPESEGQPGGSERERERRVQREREECGWKAQAEQGREESNRVRELCREGSANGKRKGKGIRCSLGRV
jgi:hypothetical protein